MYDSKKAEAFNAFFNLTKKVNSDLEMRTANTWERRARSQVESEREPVPVRSGGGFQSLHRGPPRSRGQSSSSLDRLLLAGCAERGRGRQRTGRKEILQPAR